MPHPGNIDLSALDGTNGFTINGAPSDSFSGHSVASIGDLNGDGFSDIVIGAPGTGQNGYGSRAYVVFGKPSGFASEFALSSLDGTNGFEIDGDPDSWFGLSVASAGDVNGDRVPDLIIGALGSSPHGAQSGTSYVFYGQRSGFNPSNFHGLKIYGGSSYDQAGRSVSSAGDLNGDGFDDLIVTATVVGPAGPRTHVAYVVFGSAAGGVVDLSSLDGANGFNIVSPPYGDVGPQVAAAGDVNGDGISDIVLVSSFQAYVVFGTTAGLPAVLDVSSINGANGFRLASGYGVTSVASAGDVNGDGLNDLLVGTWANYSYVVFGAQQGFSRTVDFDALNASEGFRLTGVRNPGTSGTWLASAGDLNGDGFDDIVIGAASSDGAQPYDKTGVTYVVFGRASGPTDVNLLTLDGTDGYTLAGVSARSYSGYAVASAGDFNGDGLDDLIIGAPTANPSSSGETYVVLSTLPDAAVSLIGTSASQKLVGGDLDDQLMGLGGDDHLYGHGGDDYLEGGDGADTIEGGSGSNFAGYTAAASGVSVNLGLQGAAQDTRGGGVDTLINIENLNGSDFNDDLTGDGLDNTLSGLSGDDTLRGEAGNDNLFGLAGNDYIEGGDGNDVIDGETGFNVAAYATASHFVVVNLAMQGQWQDTQGAGNDLIHDIENLVGSDFNDTLSGDGQDNVIHGGAGDDTLYGRAGDDNLFGDAGNDYIEGGDGNDVIDGGAAFNVVSYASAPSLVVVDLSQQGVWQDTQGAGNDLISNVENLIGSAFNDNLTGDGLDNVIYGGAGDDTLYGKGGNDNLFGGAGNDYIDGGQGDDTLTGNSGGDAFVFGASFGHDTITDFTAAGAGHDFILLQSSIFADFAAVQSHMSQSGSDLVISDGLGDTITLSNLLTTDLTAGDFGFI